MTLLEAGDRPAAGQGIVVLSDDWRTLSLDLSAGSAGDQICVIVRASPTELKL
jgi:hypothetical protein